MKVIVVFDKQENLYFWFSQIPTSPLTKFSHLLNQRSRTFPTQKPNPLSEAEESHLVVAEGLGEAEIL
ncbi:MAG: hypothetical protein COA70_07810 [Planctomycetota bacterium]|nr:MAG: hypothetical protein COA70_07810 [Planctomycetota bacterium]